jgi:DNA-binding beta-propeller fold protein YncE
MARLTRRRVAAAITLTSAAIAIAACGAGGTSATSPGSTDVSAGIRPEHIVQAPKNILASAGPQPNGTMWVLTGSAESRGLFELDPTSGKVLGSISVSSAARSVAQTATGVIGLALGTDRAGALELLDGRTAKVIRTVPLSAPAREVVVASDGTTFYVLTGWGSSSSVTVVDSQDGRVQGTVPVPLEAVSVAPDVQQTTLYVLQRDGRVSQISIADGKVAATFVVGDSGQSLALSPDGTALYVLKDTDAGANVAVVDVATESVRRVLPAPANCLEVLASASGSQLYEVVGTAGYGNIQIFAA